MIVMKFGGTSVGSPENIRQVIRVVARARAEQGAAAVIVSAFGGVTNGLLRLADLAAQRNEAMESELNALIQRHQDATRELVPEQFLDEALPQVDALLGDLRDVLQGVYLLREASKRSIDFISSFGERLSALIISYAMRSEIPGTQFLDARKVVRTDDNFGMARVDWDVTNQQIRNAFNSSQDLQIVTGFIGSTQAMHTTTLGRGGSDFSASIFGAALGVKEIQIWTDVSGVLTCDPRKVKTARPVPAMTYEEAMEVAHFGAKVIYPPTMAPAMNAGIPLRIKNTLEPDAPGTVIGEKGRQGGPACVISSIDKVSLLQLTGSGLIGVTGSAGRLFSALSTGKVNVILISQASSEHSICFAVKPEQAELAARVVNEEFQRQIDNGQVDPITIEEELSVVAVVGEGMREHPGIAGRIFSALGAGGVNIEAIAQGSSELNVSIVVKGVDVVRTLNLLHEALFEANKNKRIYLIGHGLIGQSFVAQMADLERRGRLNGIALCGISNSRKMVLDNNGIAWDAAAELLASSEERTDTTRIFHEMRAQTGAVLVDCTGGGQIAAIYGEVLQAGISIVTPNKIANSGTWRSFTRLRELAAASGASFLYEANVGAGLPVISSLQELLNSGDELIRIEAVLSGTLSYLFNTFAAGDSFSELLQSAKDKGFTEPDPRDDLSGMDVARKILILARECGYPLELQDVEVENLVPQSCRQVETVEAFFEALAAEDANFSNRLDAAEAEGKVLRYIATLENGAARVSLRAVGPDHPCYSLDGSDNIASFTTARYKERPMVIKGPGAGAAVTSAMCVAEVLRLARS